MNNPIDLKKNNHYKIALETYRLNYLYNNDYSHFSDKTVKFITSIDENLNNKSINVKKIKAFLNNLDLNILIEECLERKYSEEEAKKIAMQIIHLNKNDYITRNLCLDEYLIDKNLNVKIKETFTPFKACSYYFVDRIKELINTLSSPTELAKYPEQYEKFYDITKKISNKDFDKFGQYLENYLRVESRKNNCILMSTTSSTLEYIDANDYNIAKKHIGFDVILTALSKFIKKYCYLFFSL